MMLMMMVMVIKTRAMPTAEHRCDNDMMTTMMVTSTAVWCRAVINADDSDDSDQGHEDYDYDDDDGAEVMLRSQNM